MSRASLSKNPREVATMFDGVAERYDLLNDIASLGQDRAWRRATLRALAIRPGERVLDLAAGTATSSEPLAQAGADVVACDFSIGMLQTGAMRQPMLDFVAGDATSLPFADDSFDAVTISFGLRNVVDTKVALAEMARVTRSGGRMVICEFSTPTWKPFRMVYQEYLIKAIPAFASVSSNPEAYGYLAESIKDWPDQVGLGRMILRSGWSKVEVRNLTGGIVALHRAFLNLG